MKYVITLLIVVSLVACHSTTNNKEKAMYKETGTIEKNDSALDSTLDPDTKAEIIAEGFEWSEGPLWIEKHNMLLFSDVPMNTIYKWTEEKGKEVYE